ncbi:MAG: Ldh family oxidoreductase [Gemmatimonadota bacterium]|nr:Ldh family oxidoreductase [Gemmatimonadota bacterium]
MPVFTLDELSGRLRKLFTGAGLGERDTSVLVEIIVDAEASGRRTHGLVRVRPMLEYLSKRGHRKGQWTFQQECSALYDGRAGLGYLVAHDCTLKAIELARSNKAGMALAASTNTPHTGPMGYFARMCAREGLIGFITGNCQPLAAPYGAKTAVLGTNPLSFAFPSRPEPIVVDLATTATTYGQCKLALSEGRELAGDLVLDKRGEPTTDPRVALEGGALLPFGAHKGYALAVAVQILCSAFIGAPATPPPAGEYGFTVLALRKDMFVSGETYHALLGELVEKLKSAVPEEPANPVRLPGERSDASREAARLDGIHLPDWLFGEIFGKNG